MQASVEQPEEQSPLSDEQSIEDEGQSPQDIEVLLSPATELVNTMTHMIHLHGIVKERKISNQNKQVTLLEHGVLHYAHGMLVNLMSHWSNVLASEPPAQ